MESQNIEWKESWRDEYLKWICGFANAQGGKIYIGTDDNGKIIGINDSKKLLVDIPNKVKDILGIIVDTNLLSENEKEYIEILINPSSYPVSYKGEYHYRSGSTKQLLNGSALTEFLLSKTGFKWDAVPVDNVSADDLDKESFDIFRKEALLSGRMSEKDLKLSNEQLLDNLGLIYNGKLKRAAILLFHRKPEKWITGAYIKIGYFETDSDLRYQDEVHGSLFIQADRIIDLIYLKYLKADISYDNLTRIETYPFPKEAIREAVYNSIIHSNYAANIPIQISIYKDKLYIGNSCIFPVGWSIKTLLQKHNSRPYNPDIANGFFRAGLVEIWGRGIEKIYESCQQYRIPKPKYTLHPEDIMIKFTTSQTIKSPKLQNAGLNVSLENDILDSLRRNPSATAEKLAILLNTNQRTIERKIKKFKEIGILKRQGGKRYGYWEVKN